jgi:hypothetical protein
MIELFLKNSLVLNHDNNRRVFVLEEEEEADEIFQILKSACAFLNIKSSCDC